MIRRLSMVALLFAGILVGIILSGRATEREEMVARAPADTTAAEQRPAAIAATPVAGPDFTAVAAQTARFTVASM